MYLPHYHRLKKNLLQFAGSHCQDCGTVMFPEVERCTECASTRIVPSIFSGSGTVIVATEVYSYPEKFDKDGPYILAVIQLEEGPKVLAQVTDADFIDVTPGKKVRRTIRRFYKDGKDGAIVYGYKFVLSE